MMVRIRQVNPTTQTIQDDEVEITKVTRSDDPVESIDLCDESHAEQVLALSKLTDLYRET